MAVNISKHHIAPTNLMPNSPYPLLHYQSFLAPDTESIAAQFYALLTKNGWEAQWIFRYGETQKSHYHSRAHECMAVLTGHATIRFGVADSTDDMDKNTFGGEWEKGGVEIEAHAGDVFIIPAGVAHKTYSAQPARPFKLMSPGDGHGLPPDPMPQLEAIRLDGFTMMGSYPKGDGSWDFAVGGEGAATYARVWSLKPPKSDPMLGDAEEGLVGIWNQTEVKVPSQKS